MRETQIYEQYYLNLIKDNELATSENVIKDCFRYYNMKKCAAGGSQKGHKQKPRTKPAWNKGLVGKQVAWNKGLTGKQVGWNTGKKKEGDARLVAMGKAISSARKGKPLSEEHKRNLSKAHQLRSASKPLRIDLPRKQKQERRRPILKGETDRRTRDKVRQREYRWSIIKDDEIRPIVVRDFAILNQTSSAAIYAAFKEDRPLATGIFKGWSVKRY